MRDRGSHKTKRASYVEESWAIVYRNAVIRSWAGGRDGAAQGACHHKPYLRLDYAMIRRRSRRYCFR